LRVQHQDPSIEGFEHLRGSRPASLILPQEDAKIIRGDDVADGAPA
jgi:hypothetical protein